MSGFDDPFGRQEELFDETIERATVIERLKAGIVITLLRGWRQSENRIVDATRLQFSRIRRRGPVVLQQANFRNLLRGNRQIIREATRSAQRLVQSDALEFSRLQDEWTRVTFTNILPEINIGGPLPAQLRREIVNARPFNGSTLAEWFGKFERGVEERVPRDDRPGRSSTGRRARKT